MKIDYLCKADSDGVISSIDVDYIVKLMREGGLCILPSDSSYILTGNFMGKDVMKDIKFLLARDDNQEFSLAFNNYNQVIRDFDLNIMAEGFIKELTPGGLTFVAEANDEFMGQQSAQKLYTDGTIGIRLTDSKVETQLACQFPIPTAPIRDSKTDEATSNLEDAIKIVNEQYIKLMKYRKFAAVNGMVAHCGEVSTVVKEEYVENEGYYIIILREGIIPREKIEKVAQKYNYVGVKDPQKGYVHKFEEICE